MTAPIKQASFSGGEITPLLYGRTDHVKYETGLRTMRNMMSMRHGGATRRPGTQYIGTTLNGGNPVRLIPFIFNETGNGQSYVLEFGNQYIAFYQNGGVVVSGGNPYTISSPYLQADLQTLKFAESADIITIVHQNYPPMELKRFNHTNWQLVNITIGPIITTPVISSAIGGNSGLTKQYYIVTAISSLNGEESLISNSVLASVGGADSTHSVVVSWATIGSAGSYRVYKTFGSTADTFGYIATVVSNSYTDFGSTPDFTNSSPIYFNPFAGVSVPVITSLVNLSSYILNYTYIYAVTSIVGGIESAPVYLYSANPNPPDTSFPNIRAAAWSAVIGATGYNVYRNNGVGNNVLGIIITNTSGLTFTDSGGYVPNFSSNPPASPNLNPTVVGFSQQRRFFAATLSNPLGFWGSQTGNFYNFNTHAIPVASDSIIGSLAGEEVNQIEAILEQKFMLMLTSGAELYIQGGGSGVVTPQAINASVQSQYGCSSLRPLKVSDVLLFNQALGSFIRDLAFDFVIDGYRGNDVTVFSSHLFEGNSLVDWSYQKIPDSIVWAVRNDGVLLGLTYVREQQVLAWHRHDFTNGTVENVCAIPENGQYVVYLSIKRTINGTITRYIERLSSRIWSDVLNATYLDCFSSYNGINTASTTMTLSVSGNNFDQTSSAYQQHLTLTSSGAFFNSSMVGDQIFLSDQDFIINKGNTVDPENDGSSFALSSEGNQIRCTIISYQSSTSVTVTPNRAVPSTLQGIGVTTWARAVRKVTGLTYLIGQQVSVWADRTVVGSPLNMDVSTIYTVASDGSLTLDKPYSVIYVGLPITSDLETLDIETSFGETLIGRRKIQKKLALYLYQTRNLMAGSENPDSNPNNVNNDPNFQLYELKSGVNRLTYDQPPELITEQDTVAEDTRWNKNGRIFIRNVDPTPMTILAVVPAGDSPSPSPFYEKV